MNIDKVNNKYILEIFSNEDKYSYLNRSILYYASEANLNENNIKIVDRVIKYYDINKYNDFLIYFQDHKSLIQVLVEQNKLKEASFLVENMIHNNANNECFYCLMSDLPMLLFSAKFNINEFFHISNEENI